MTHEPHWWAEARRLRARGNSYPWIGRRLGKDPSTVIYAVNEQYRERRRKQNIRWFQRNGKRSPQCRARTKVLEAAREEAANTGAHVDDILRSWKAPARYEWRANR